eukprot:1182067-Prorocentrum_minimum.AAC.1
MAVGPFGRPYIAVRFGACTGLMILVPGGDEPIYLCPCTALYHPILAHRPRLSALAALSLAAGGPVPRGMERAGGGNVRAAGAAGRIHRPDVRGQGPLQAGGRVRAAGPGGQRPLALDRLRPRRDGGGDGGHPDHLQRAAARRLWQRARLAGAGVAPAGDDAHADWHGGQPRDHAARRQHAGVRRRRVRGDLHTAGLGRPHHRGDGHRGRRRQQPADVRAHLRLALHPTGNTLHPSELPPEPAESRRRALVSERALRSEREPSVVGCRFSPYNRFERQSRESARRMRAGDRSAGFFGCVARADGRSVCWPCLAQVTGLPVDPQRATVTGPGLAGAVLNTPTYVLLTLRDANGALVTDATLGANINFVVEAGTASVVISPEDGVPGTYRIAYTLTSAVQTRISFTCVDPPARKSLALPRPRPPPAPYNGAAIQGRVEVLPGLNQGVIDPARTVVTGDALFGVIAGTTGTFSIALANAEGVIVRPTDALRAPGAVTFRVTDSFGVEVFAPFTVPFGRRALACFPPPISRLPPAPALLAGARSSRVFTMLAPSVWDVCAPRVLYNTPQIHAEMYISDGLCL